MKDLQQYKAGSLVNPADLPDFDPTDDEGYSDTPFEVSTYVKIDHSDNGMFSVKNTLLGEQPSVDELKMVVLGDHYYARIRWTDSGDVACKSRDGIIGYNPITQDECGRCAVCEYNKREGDDRCKPSPIFIGDEIGKDLGLIVITFGPSAMKGIKMLKARLQIEADAAGYQAKRLPLYFFPLTITTNKEERKGMKPFWTPVFDLGNIFSKERLADYRKRRKQYLDIAEREDFIDTEQAKEAANAEDSDLPF